MSAARQTKDILWYLFGRYPGGQWRGRELFTWRFWRWREYIWHDTFGKRFNRVVTCPMTGHSPRPVMDWDNRQRVYCFRCEQWIDGGKP